MIIDPRRYATQKRIQQALVALISSTDFKRVTVGQILKLAHVSRGTFYRYYLDKYDLLAKTEDRLITGARDIFKRYDKPNLTVLPEAKINDAFYALLVYLYQRRRTVATLLNCEDSALQSKIHDLIRATINLPTPVAKQSEVATLTMPLALVEELVVQNIMTILDYWLQQAHVVAPKVAYQIFVVSRQLSPGALTELLQDSMSGCD